MLRVRTNLELVRAHIRAVLDETAPGPAFADAMATLAADIPILVVDVERLSDLVDVTRRRYADLVAAGRAALVAVLLDGDRGGWRYLADELPAPPPDHPLWTVQQQYGWGGAND